VGQQERWFYILTISVVFQAMKAQDCGSGITFDGRLFLGGCVERENPHFPPLSLSLAYVAFSTILITPHFLESEHSFSYNENTVIFHFTFLLCSSITS
jgi:hypothetical protein